MSYIKSFIGLSLVLFASFALTACSDDDEFVAPSISKPQFNVATLDLNESDPYSEICISNISDKIKLTSSDTNIATIEQIDSLHYWVIAQSPGKTRIIMTDNLSVPIDTIDVQIDGFQAPTIQQENIMIKPHEVKHLTNAFVSGANCRMELSDKGTATINAQMVSSSNEIQIEGNNCGSVSITVFKEFWPIRIYSVDVVDKYPLELGVDEFHWQKKDDKTRSIDILGVRTGNGGYTISCTNENIITAEFIPAWWEPRNEYINSIGFRITSNGVAGKASLVVTDSEGLSKSMDVVIY